MSLEIGETLYLLLIGLILFEGVLIFPVFLTMHFLMPKVILEKYFKPPYFKPMEVEMFTGIPYALMRTVMLLWAITRNRKSKRVIAAATSAPRSTGP